MHTRMRRPRHVISVLAAVAVVVPIMAGCGNSGQSTNGGASAAQGSGSSHLPKDDALAALVPQKYRQEGGLKVAALAGQVPMMFVGDDGKTLVGVEADILHDVGELLGIDVTLTDTKFDTIIPGIAAGRYQLAAGSITSTKERKKKVDFLVYAKYGQALAVKAGNPKKITFDSTCGQRVAVLNGGIQQTEMVPALTKTCESQGKPAVVGQSFPDLDSTFLSLESGRTDAVLLNDVVVQYRAAASKGEFEVGDRGYRNDDKGIVLAKESDLGPALVGAVKKLQSDGTLQKIFDKWQVGSVVIPAKIETE